MTPIELYLTGIALAYACWMLYAMHFWDDLWVFSDYVVCCVGLLSMAVFWPLTLPWLGFVIYRERKCHQ